MLQRYRRPADPDEMRGEATLTPIQEIDLLQALTAVSREVGAAVQIGEARVGDPVVREKLGEFRLDHERHVREIDRIVADRGVPADDLPEGEAALLSTWASAASTIGWRAILLATIASEELVGTAYDSALDVVWDEQTWKVLDSHLRDEERHLQWLDENARALLDRTQEEAVVAENVELVSD